MFSSLLVIFFPFLPFDFNVFAIIKARLDPNKTKTIEKPIYIKLFTIQSLVFLLYFNLVYQNSGYLVKSFLLVYVFNFLIFVSLLLPQGGAAAIRAPLELLVDFF